MPELPDITVYIERLAAKAQEAMDPGGIDVLTSNVSAFEARLRAENHTLKRSLTDPRLFSDIGNAYSDEILHRARLSPLALSRGLPVDDVQVLFDATRAVLTEWTNRLRHEAGDWREKVTAFRPDPRHGRSHHVGAAMASPARYAPPQCNASSTPTIRRTTARAARPAASCLPTASCPSF